MTRTGSRSPLEATQAVAWRFHNLVAAQCGFPSASFTEGVWLVTGSSMTSEQAIELVRELCEAVGDHIAVWHRGSTETPAANRQVKAVAAVFTELVGRGPTPEELDAISATAVFGKRRSERDTGHGTAEMETNGPTRRQSRRRSRTIRNCTSRRFGFSPTMATGTRPGPRDRASSRPYPAGGTGATPRTCVPAGPP